MPAYNGNAPYLSFDGVVVATPFISYDFSAKNNTQDVTAGTGATDMQRAPGLTDTSLKLTLAYLVGSVGSIIQKIKAGNIVSVELGPEGNVSGKPRHVQSFIVEDVGHGEKVSKDKVAFEVTLANADAPTSNMHAGAVYP